MDVAVYARVSTKHEEQISSLKNQKKHYTEYCIVNKYNMVRLYADEGLSATSPKRKEFLEMLSDAGLDFEKAKNSNKLNFDTSDRKPKFNLIITKDVSRFARNIDAMEIAKLLRDKGVFVLFENAGFSTEDNDWELRLSLLLTFSQQESIDRSKKVAFAYKQRSINGIYHMTKNLYGYRYDKFTKETSVVEEEAEIVRKMFDLFINDGYGVKNISNYLNENKIKTQNGKEWVGGNVRRLLRNEKYIGRVILNKYTNNGVTSTKKRIKRPESEWVILEDAIPAIIDMDTWNKTQEIIQIRVGKTKEGSLTGSRRVKNIFYNKLYCGKCGKSFVRVVTTKQRKHGEIKEINYICANRRQRKSCDNKMLSHNVLVRRITHFGQAELQFELKSKREMYIRLISMEKKTLQLKLKMSEKTINNTKVKIQEIDNEVDKLLTAFSKSSSTVVSVIEKKIEQLTETKFVLNQKLLEYDVISIENEIKKIDDSLINMSGSIKEEYSFDETLRYLGKITVKDSEVVFNVGANIKLEPNLNIDVNRFDDLSNLEEIGKRIDDVL